MCFVMLGAGVWLAQSQEVLPWKACLRQPAVWYASKEAQRIAENVLLWQRESGGWPKNQEMATNLQAADRARLLTEKNRHDSTIDNGATTAQIRFLAARIAAGGPEAERASLIRGLDYLLAAQYAHGGWPQNYPNPTGYHKLITFNDDAMVSVLRCLRDVSGGKGGYASVDRTRRDQAAKAVGKGIDCILRCQIRVDGVLTAWCAQHDEVTFAPAPARSYEKVSLSGGESVEIIRLLMSIDKPSPEVVTAVEAAVAWLRRSALHGIRVQRIQAAGLPRGRDTIVVPDPSAMPIWARFYDIKSNKPIFCGRDGMIKDRLADIEPEQRSGYSWYTSRAATLLDIDYPRWQAAQKRPTR